MFRATNFFVPLGISLVNTSEPSGLLMALVPNFDIENWKLQSCLVAGCLLILISEHGYLKSLCAQHIIP